VGGTNSGTSVAVLQTEGTHTRYTYVEAKSKLHRRLYPIAGCFLRASERSEMQLQLLQFLFPGLVSYIPSAWICPSCSRLLRDKKQVSPASLRYCRRGFVVGRGEGRSYFEKVRVTTTACDHSWALFHVDGAAMFDYSVCG